MYDAAGSPILTMSAKLLSLHQRWTVYRGESTKETDVIFTLKAPKFWTTTLSFDVFLPGNRDEHVCDFHVKSRHSDSQCTIYKESTIIAEMNDKSTWSQSLNGKGALAIRIHPEVDYAFITALMIIHSEMHMVQTAAVASGEAAGTAVAVV
ncbi:hypothetical protein H6P81_006493 [Aristolochia fimbriata]|uniref:Uncharacterized protein n=1 Tax=Aristolochia fimbriata TaxID=158543 RepID=A0AAV7EYM6_ARIFI|nr:hypothetical protein H6P81_006493 [Aristolochia fimbriata]